MIESNMITNMIQLKIFSLMNDNIDYISMLLFGLIYFLYKLIGDYRYEILHYFSLTGKKYVYHLKLIYSHLISCKQTEPIYVVISNCAKCIIGLHRL